MFSFRQSIVDNWFAIFRSVGINVLHNSNVKIVPSKNSDATICMAGVDDFTSRLSGLDSNKLWFILLVLFSVVLFSQTGHGMNVTAALLGCDRKRGPVILLTHQPNAARIILDSQIDRQIDLIFSGKRPFFTFYPL